MADHVPYIDNDSSLANRVVAAWLNQVNKLVFWGRRPNYATTTGSANAQILTLETGSLYSAGTEADGDEFCFTAGFSNNAAMTLQVLQPAGANVARAVQITGVALAGGEVVAGSSYRVTRLGTTWQLSSVSSNVTRSNNTQTLTNKTLTSPVITTPTVTNQANVSQTLTDQATVTWDANSGAFASLTATASRTMAAPTNLKAGGHYVLLFAQNATGGWTLTWNAVFKGLYGSAMPQPNTAASSVTMFVFESDGTNLYLSNVTKQPTIQTFTSGSGTYTTPVGCIRIEVTAVGGGAGGGTTAGGGGGAGTAGGNTTFSTLTAGGGTGGQGAGGGVGAGGTATGGDVNIPGGSGCSGAQATAIDVFGGAGGVSFLGGNGGAAGGNQTGTNAATNSGSGGSGFGGNNAVGGGGGGAGGYVMKIISFPAATYSYAVGAGGAGAASAGNGAAGIIIVREFYS